MRLAGKRRTHKARGIVPGKKCERIFMKTFIRTFIAAAVIALAATKSPAEFLDFASSRYIRFNTELNCVEAFVRAPAHSSAKAADRILQARERAELLFYVKLIDFLFGAQIEGWDARRSTVRSEEGKNKVDRVSGNAVQMMRERNAGGHIMRNVTWASSRWDGYFFEIYGQFPMPPPLRIQETKEKTEEQIKPGKSEKSKRSQGSKGSKGSKGSQRKARSRK